MLRTHYVYPAQSVIAGLRCKEKRHKSRDRTGPNQIKLNDVDTCMKNNVLSFCQQVSERFTGQQFVRELDEMKVKLDGMPSPTPTARSISNVNVSTKPCSNFDVM